MKIVIHYLNEIDGVEIFPIIGIIIFFSFFVFLLYYLFGLDGSFINDMGELPLDNEVTEKTDKS